MMKHSIYPLFILPLLFIELSAQTLPSDLIWNDDETGYYEIKEQTKQALQIISDLRK